MHLLTPAIGTDNYEAIEILERYGASTDDDLQVEAKREMRRGSKETISMRRITLDLDCDNATDLLATAATHWNGTRRRSVKRVGRRTIACTEESTSVLNSEDGDGDTQLLADASKIFGGNNYGGTGQIITEKPLGDQVRSRSLTGRTKQLKLSEKEKRSSLPGEQELMSMLYRVAECLEE